MVTGHSLGAGVSALLALRLRSSFPGETPCVTSLIDSEFLRSSFPGETPCVTSLIDSEFLRSSFPGETPCVTSLIDSEFLRSSFLGENPCVTSLIDSLKNTTTSILRKRGNVTNYAGAPMHGITSGL